MHTTRTVVPTLQHKEQPLTLEVCVGLATPGRCRRWLCRCWQWCAGCLTVGRRHRSPPRLERQGNAHQAQDQQWASADCLDRLTQERPALRTAIYPTLWR